MYTTLTFHNLPFTPISNQVIYVEHSFDPEYNRLIVDNYDRLKWELRKHGYELVYLPKLLLEPALERKVRYFAPYLNSQIVAENPVHSSLLMRYLSPSMSPAKVSPSFLFCPEADRECCTFRCAGMDAHDPKWIGSLIEGITREDPSRQSVSDQVKFALEGNFRRVLGAGQRCMLPDRDGEMLDDVCDGIVEVDAKSSLPDVCDHGSWFSGFSSGCSPAKGLFRKDVFAEAAEDPDEEDEDDIRQMLEDFRDLVERMEIRGIARAAIHELVDSRDKLSRLVITSDYRILLPDYNNIEITLTPIRKALYLLFLRYPEGIRLKELSDHFRELFNIYRQLQPRLREDKRVVTVTQLCNSTTNRASENIAAIRCAFCNKFDEHLAKEYYISGSAGNPYKIDIDRKLVIYEE